MTAQAEGDFGIPKSRLQSLSDLIFGLALSIGAFSLINAAPSSPGQILPNILAFGFSFLILMTVWIRYTRMAAVLPFETAGTVYLNVLMLFFVAIEPYLFNLLFSASISNSAANLTSTYYAIDLGGIFFCLAYLTQSLTDEGKGLVPLQKIKYFRAARNMEVASALVFLVSTLPILWTAAVFGLPLRICLWVFLLAFGRIGIRIFGSR